MPGAYIKQINFAEGHMTSLSILMLFLYIQVCYYTRLIIIRSGSPIKYVKYRVDEHDEETLTYVVTLRIHIDRRRFSG